MEIIFFSIFIGVCVSGTPSDINALIGAALAGFILGCFVLGEDKQLHSRIFFWFAIVGLLLLGSLTTWGLAKQSANGKVRQNNPDTLNKVLNQYFSEAQTYSNLTKDFTS